MKKRFLAFFVAVAMAIPIALIAGAPSGTIKITKTGSKKSAVAFSHGNHKFDCKKCHHKGKNSKCISCHKGAKGKKALHKNCRGCHKSKGGPTKCRACHK